MDPTQPKRPTKKEKAIHSTTTSNSVPQTGPRTDTPGLDTRALAHLAVEAALDKKALEPVLIDLRAVESYTDFILLVSGRSDRHVQNVAEGIAEAFVRDLGRRPLGSEGQSDGRWALLDYGDIVVHVFYHPLRDFYDIEGLWCDAPRIELDIPADARVHAGNLY